jgi:ubiquinone/menaquinone biosynthesis C-methylase UbiE
MGTATTRRDYRDEIKKDWDHAHYYELAEGYMDVFWNDGSVFRKYFEMLDLESVVELACGWGRHSDYARAHYQPGTITLVDVLGSNISRCRQRFAGDDRYHFVVNSGSDLCGLSADTYSAVFCYDAMVHFEYDDVFAYIREIHRVLRPGGRALLHHSNYDGRPGSAYSQNPHWRNFMSAALFAHVAMRTGFRVVEQHKLDWGDKELDCLTLLEKPVKD